MQISVTCRHMEMTDSLRDHSISRAQNDLADFKEHIESVHVVLSVQRHNHIADVIIQGRRNITVEASEASPDMYHSIDQAFAKALKQIRRTNEKMIDGMRQRDNIAEVERVIGGDKAQEEVAE